MGHLYKFTKIKRFICYLHGNDLKFSSLLKGNLITSRLRQWNLLDEDVKVTVQRNRHRQFSNYYTTEAGLCFCNDKKGLFNKIGITCDPVEWRLFIDSSSRSLKAVFCCIILISYRRFHWRILCK